MKVSRGSILLCGRAASRFFPLTDFVHSHPRQGWMWASVVHLYLRFNVVLVQSDTNLLSCVGPALIPFTPKRLKQQPRIRYHWISRRRVGLITRWSKQGLGLLGPRTITRCVSSCLCYDRSLPHTYRACGGVFMSRKLLPKPVDLLDWYDVAGGVESSFAGCRNAVLAQARDSLKKSGILYFGSRSLNLL